MKFQKRELLRIGFEFANDTNLEKSSGFDVLFNDFHEVVYIPDFLPWKRVNDSWTGALGHLHSGLSIWIEFMIVQGARIISISSLFEEANSEK